MNSHTDMILVIDDDETLLMLAEANLLSGGMDVLTAPDGKTGVELAASNMVDLVLLDINLPDINGYDVCRMIRDLPNLRDLPIVMLTSEEDYTSIHKSYEAGANDFITKPPKWPIEINRLQNLIRARKTALELRQKDRELHHAQKLEAIGRLAGGIAHDFNNLLSVINGCAEMATEDLEDRPDTKRLVEEIFGAGQQAASLTKQLLAFSRKHSIEVQPIQVNDVVYEMGTLIGRLIGASIDVQYSLSDDVGLIESDLGRLQQVLMNLVVNASDAMPGGGNLIMSSRNVAMPQAENPLPETHEEGNYVLVSVKDSGTGMTPETQARIFEPFFTTKDIHKGTGLGLATVFGIVKHSKGFIKVTSELGKGTTFDIYFPELLADENEGSKAPVMQESMTGSGIVLLVEDEVGLRRLLRDLLSRHGYEVIVAENGERAIDLIEAAGHPFDLVITDWLLPGAGGQIVVETLRKKELHAPVIVISGHLGNGANDTYFMQNDIAFLQKPFPLDLFLLTVQDLVMQDHV